MNKSRAVRIVLYAGLIFLAGAITGALVAPMVGRHFMRLPDSPQLSRLLLAHLRSGLDLTAEQEKKIKPLVEKSCADMEAIHHQTMQRVVDRLNETSEKISAFLTAEQKVKLKKMEAEHRLHLRHFHHAGGPVEPPPP
jgi:Spy/CpxP family protein refolding chaperone